MQQKHLMLGLKLTVSIGLISLLLYWVDWQQAYQMITGANPYWLVVSGALVITVVLLDGLRLNWMIPIPELRFNDHIRLALQSAFVLQLGFGMAAGDAYRTVRYAAKSGKVLKPVVHIIAARLAGLTSIGIVALAISGWVLISGDGSAQELGNRIIKLVILVAATLFVVASGIVFFVSNRSKGIPDWYVAAKEAFRSITPRVWALSIFMVFVRGLSFACALFAVGQMVSLYIPVLAGNTATLTTLLPIAFGGLGIREGALAGTTVLLGVPFAAAFSAAIVMRIVVVVASCIGLLLSYMIPEGTPPTVEQVPSDG